MATRNDYPLRRAIIETIDDRGISLTELCRRTGLSRPQLWRYVNGRHDMLAHNVDRLRVALGLVIYDPLSIDEGEYNG